MTDRMFEKFLQGYVPGIKVFFIGYDPKFPDDFGEGTRLLNRVGTQAGPHCLSTIWDSESHPHKD